jgi:hypothetical protein
MLRAASQECLATSAHFTCLAKSTTSNAESAALPYTRQPSQTATTRPQHAARCNHNQPLRLPQQQRQYHPKPPVNYLQSSDTVTSGDCYSMQQQHTQLTLLQDTCRHPIISLQAYGVLLLARLAAMCMQAFNAEQQTASLSRLHHRQLWQPTAQANHSPAACLTPASA